MTTPTSTAIRNVLDNNDIKAQKNLQKIWKAYKNVHKVNQTDFAAEKLDWTQGNFSQYLTGQVRIGDKALIMLCKALEVNPWDVREELRDIETVAELDNSKRALNIIENSILSCDNVPVEIMNAWKQALSVLNDTEEQETIAA